VTRLLTAVPGHAFLSQGGGLLVNSKATFRAIAAGASVPLAVGTVCPDRCSAENAIVEMMADGEPIILKHEYFSSGKGNEILSPRDGVRPIGASRVVIAAGRPAGRGMCHCSAYSGCSPSGSPTPISALTR
jgi:hypothetical protein